MLERYSDAATSGAVNSGSTDSALGVGSDVGGSEERFILPETGLMQRKMTRSFSRSTILTSKVGRLTVAVSLLTVAFVGYIFLLSGSHDSMVWRWSNRFPLDNDGARYLAKLGRHPNIRLIDEPYRPLLLDTQKHVEPGLVIEDRQEGLFRPNIPVDYYHPTKLNTLSSSIELVQIEDLKSNQRFSDYH